MMKLYRYIVTHDTGFAPNPFHGYCTLATCKPKIRRQASVGDWIAGFGSKSGDCEGRLIFAMRVAEALTFEEYWQDARFEAKKPRHGSRYIDRCGDNVYRRDPFAGGWIQLPCFHCDVHMADDTKTNRVLIATEFVYFGKEATELPTEFLAWGDKYFIGFRNHQVHNLSEDRKAKLIKWLESLSRDGGCLGEPAQLGAILDSSEGTRSC